MFENVRWPKIARMGREDLGPAARFYLGDDVCRGKRLGLATLFVRGKQTLNDIGREVHRRRYNSKTVQQIYLGAQGSFDEEDCLSYYDLATALLNIGHCVSLEVPFEYARRRCAQEIPAELLTNDRFTLVVRLDWPRLRALGPQTEVRLADAFLGDNGGMWTVPLPTLTADERYSPWRWFAKDEALQT
jgi:hypothetical protein